MLAALLAAQAAAAPAAREPTDVYIRRLAGLPADSARGAIELLDVGHGPMETMLSIVARRDRGGWSVSYACAGSPACAAGADHRALAYRLAPAAAARVDALLARLRGGAEPDDVPAPGWIGGWLSVAVDDRGFHHRYRRAGGWGPVLGPLEEALRPAEPG